MKLQSLLPLRRRPFGLAGIVLPCPLLLAIFYSMDGAVAGTIVTDERNAGAQSTAICQGWGTLTWSNPTRVTGAQNGSSATVAMTTASGGLMNRSRCFSLTNFGFTVPSNALILDVKIVPRVRTSNSTGGGLVGDYVVRLKTPSGNSVSYPSLRPWPSALGDMVHEGPDGWWGLTNLSPSVINNTDFGVELAAGMQTHGGSATANVDAVKVSVRYYLPAAGEVSGRVFRDYNANGNWEPDEAGNSGVTVNLYNDASATPVGTATTDANGIWFVSGIAGGTKLRAEAVGLPGTLKAAPKGASTASLVAFATAPANNVNFGLVQPQGDTAGTPLLATNCYVTGNAASGPNANGHVLVLAPYTATGEVAPLDVSKPDSYGGITKVPEPTAFADAVHVGATYGLAWQASSRTLFAGAYLKRKAGYGPNGPGAIYQINAGADKQMATGDDTRSLFLDLNVLFPGAAGTNHHSSDASNLLINDSVAVPYVSKESLGDVDISADGQTLYVMCLADKTLYEIPIGSPPTVPPVASIRRYPLPSGIVSGILDSNVRPFGIGIKGNRVFVGGTTTEENAGDTPADGVRSLALVWEITLSTAGGVHANKYTERFRTAYATHRYWEPWDNSDTDNSHPEAILSDIEFLGEDMILGFRDRFGDKTPQNGLGPQDNPWPSGHGDILRTSWSGSAWVLESNGSAGSLTGAAVGNGDGPGGGEFYDDDSSDGSTEGAVGGLAVHRGRAEVSSTFYDMINSFGEDSFYTGGWQQFGSHGSDRNSFAVYDVNELPAGAYGKASGVGDLEMIYQDPPIEIGNRVWADNDRDGVQDPSELPLAGVTVTLKSPTGAFISSAVTDGNGQYYFSNGPGTDSGSVKYNLSALTANTSGFRLCIASNSPGLGGRTITLANTDGTANGDERDSDAVLAGGNYVISFNTPAAGETNHSYDFGFTTATLGLGNLVFIDSTTNGHADSGEGVNGVTVTLFTSDGLEVPVGADGILGTADDAAGGMLTSGGGYYRFGGLPQAAYFVKVPASEFGSGKPLQGQLSLTANGDDTGVDDGVDENGVDNFKPASNGIQTMLIQLAYGTEPFSSGGGATESGQNSASDNATETDVDLTIDFGFAPGPPCMNLLENGSFESDVLPPAAPHWSGLSTFVDPLNSTRFNVTANNAPAGWTLSGQEALPGGLTQAYWIQDASRATNGRRFVFLRADAGLPATQTFCLNGYVPLSATGNCNTQFVEGQRYRISFDYAMFDPNQSGGNPNQTHELWIESKYFGPGIEMFPPEAPLNGELLRLSAPLEDWNNIHWRHAVIYITPPVGSGMTYFDLAISSPPNGNRGVLYDNVKFEGVCCDASLGNLVWSDIDNDGLYEPNGSDGNAATTEDNETGINGVVLALCDGSGNAVDADGTQLGVQPLTTTTGDNPATVGVVEQGWYAFTNLPAGNYQVKIAAPPPSHPLSSWGADLSDNQQDGDDNGSQTASGAAITGPVAALSTAENDLTLDFGLVPFALFSIKGQVRFDSDRNGSFLDPDQPLSSFNVSLYRDLNSNDAYDPGIDDLVDSLVTAADGQYCFEDLPNGRYLVVESPPNPMLESSNDRDGNNDRSIPVALLGADSTDNDFLETIDPQGWFYDVETCQIVPGGAVSVSGPAPVDLVFDGSSGEYAWIAPIGGTYTMTITPPPGYTIDPSRPNLGSLDAPAGPGTLTLGSDINPAGTELLNCSAAANPWYITFILQPGDQAVVHNNIPLLRIKPLSFAGWQSRNPLGGQNGAGQNPDGDLYTNLEEFAFCFPPNGSLNDGCVLEIVSNDQGTPATGDDTVDVCLRRVTGITGLTYTLETIPDLSGSSPNGGGWTDVSGIVPTVTVHPDGTETACFPGINAVNALSVSQGFVRVRVSADLNGDTDTTDPGETARTEASGWMVQTVAQQCESCAMPFLKCGIFSGVIDGNSASTMNIATSVAGGDFNARLTGPCYFVEVLDAPYAGHRWPIDIASSGDSVIAVQAGTMALTADVLAGLRCVVRAGQTVADLFNPADFHATTNPVTADHVLIYSSAGPQWLTYSLIDFSSIGGGSHWMHGAQIVDNVCIDSCQGVFIHRMVGSTSLFLSGEVRETPCACPLAPGYTFVGSPFPLAQTPSDRLMTWDGADFNGFHGGTNPAAADQILFWVGDTQFGHECYESHWLLDAQVAPYRRWVAHGDSDVVSEDAANLFMPARAAFYCSPTGNPAYVMPTGWTP